MCGLHILRRIRRKRMFCPSIIVDTGEYYVGT